MMASSKRLQNTNVTRLSAEEVSTVFRIEKMGVMPLPAAHKK